jgi:outer membrane protein assembly factor BamA
MPFAAEHVIKGNFAARTQAFNVAYDGHYVGLAGLWDVKLNAAYLSPDNIRNFHGLGNESENTEDDRKFYQARLSELTVSPSLFKQVDELVSVSVGPFLHFVDARRDEGRFVGQPQEGISATSFDPQWFTGAHAGLLIDATDSKFNPKSGIRWLAGGNVNFNLSDGGETFSNLSSALSTYYSPSYSPQVTLSARVGGAHNLGEFPFYSAVTLGSKSNLRGFRSTRFAGRTSFYQNVDLRIEIFKFSTYLAIGKAGIHGFADNGRVWTDGESSSVWHQGYGGGVWFEMFGLLVFQGTLGFSEDDTTVNVGVGFLY